MDMAFCTATNWQVVQLLLSMAITPAGELREPFTMKGIRAMIFLTLIATRWLRLPLEPYTN
ncbi:MAG: hypothetical protein A3K19_01075 [Lentisphaerae bacterium RIFOXYB12_FULL_65_16]|nr:MAG: hypothetical protein A3K18_30605 [Lentisphaerae bacterium RIFOXYA12_64_32]OGV93716.1 MAG: hypothetical protein A3K19_01075 [Lentisphaerae bacterium RIFOXYB12_FULL_65_16]